MARPAELLEQALRTNSEEECNQLLLEMCSLGPDVWVAEQTGLTKETVKALRRPDKLTPADRRKLKVLFPKEFKNA